MSNLEEKQGNRPQRSERRDVSHSEGMSPKTIGIVSYITIIGWVIAYMKNKDNMTDYGTFHIRQSLGLSVAGIALSFVSVVPFLGWVISTLGSLVLIVFWIMAIISAINEEQKPLPLVGEFFQDLFKSV
ncbi:MAG: hypothetical protein JJT94_01295 [Bernardetiaceae bacterium]|nr:hypothetical protein [Bernardetiaceae bacterium]